MNKKTNNQTEWIRNNFIVATDLLRLETQQYLETLPKPGETPSKGTIKREKNRYGNICNLVINTLSLVKDYNFGIQEAMLEIVRFTEVLANCQSHKNIPRINTLGDSILNLLLQQNCFTDPQKKELLQQELPSFGKLLITRKYYEYQSNASDIFNYLFKLDPIQTLMWGLDNNIKFDTKLITKKTMNELLVALSNNNPTRKSYREEHHIEVKDATKWASENITAKTVIEAISRIAPEKLTKDVWEKMEKLEIIPKIDRISHLLANTIPENHVFKTDQLITPDYFYSNYILELMETLEQKNSKVTWTKQGKEYFTKHIIKQIEGKNRDIFEIQGLISYKLKEEQFKILCRIGNPRYLEIDDILFKNYNITKSELQDMLPNAAPSSTKRIKKELLKYI